MADKETEFKLLDEKNKEQFQELGIELMCEIFNAKFNDKKVEKARQRCIAEAPEALRSEDLEAFTLQVVEITYHHDDDADEAAHSITLLAEGKDFD